MAKVTVSQSYIVSCSSIHWTQKKRSVNTEVVYNCIDSVNISDALGDQSIHKQVYQKNLECQNDQNQLEQAEIS